MRPDAGPLGMPLWPRNQSAGVQYVSGGGGLRLSGSFVLAVAGLILAVSAPAATLHTESFDTGEAGWTGTNRLVVESTDGVLLGRFPDQSVPMPESGSFLATATASAGAFVGDYTGGGIQLIGFSFLAEDVPPSSALLRWSSSTSSFFRSFASYVAETGVWHRIAISLHSRDAGQWVGGTTPAFEDSLRDVQRVEIQLARAGMAAQRYRIDDVFIDVLPAGAGITGDGTLMWSRLRTNVAYVVQAAVDPTQAWEDVDAFVATDRMQAWVDPASTNERQKVYRLMTPELQP